jgi:predicted outer membrane repeat protein
MKTRKNPNVWLATAMFLLLTAYATAAGGTIYVDVDASGANDGSNWADAYNFLQDALAEAEVSPKPVDICVAQGLYKPDQGSGITPGDQMATFRLINAVAVRGGYAGFGETDPNDRDVKLYETILSGDLLGDDGPNYINRNDNSNHVVTAGGYGEPVIDETAVLEGFIIRAGKGSYGAGMLNISASPTIINCIFNENTATDDDYGGGGMYNCNNSSPTLIHCTFSENTTDGQSTSVGGGIFNKESNPTLIYCTFVGNSAGEGGAMANGWWGDTSATLLNCIFIGNTAYYGGAIYGGNMTLINSVFVANSAPTLNGHTLEITNCILWNGGNEIDDGGEVLVTYSNVEGGWPGQGNINVDPMFVDLNGADNVLGTADDNLRLLPGSPCLDAGDNSAVPPSLLSDFDGNPRIINDIVDMGAFEGPAQSFLLSTETITVPEGDTAVFTVALAKPPVGTVQVTVASHSGDPDITVASGNLLIFDPVNYAHPQPVSLAAAEDGDYINGETRILLSAAGIETAGISASEMDNDYSIPAILYVDDDAHGSGDGTSWKDAFTDLQEALINTAAFPGVVKEIRVAQGTYKPAGPFGDRRATFHLINGLTIKGGYAGFGERRPDARDVDKYQTILSGDLNSNDVQIDNPEDLQFEPTRLDNSYTIVTGSGTNSSAVIDGFSIKAGNAERGEYQSRSAGMNNNSGSPTVRNCTFSGNSAPQGGGMLNYNNSNPTLLNCTFIGNTANKDFGGGMSNQYYSNPTLIGCTFIDNVADCDGGGMYNGASSPTLTNCLFINNKASVEYSDERLFEFRGGGAIYNYTRSNPTHINCIFRGNIAYRGGAIYNCGYNSKPVFYNCLFADNSSGGEGAAIYNRNVNYGECTRLTLLNCTFAYNSAPIGSALAFGPLRSGDPARFRLTNCICRDGGSEITNIDQSLISITYSNIQEGWPGEGNIDFDPLFVDPNGDYHLLPNSPSVNAGDPDFVAEPDKTDLDGRPRVFGGRIDMGAYEYNPSIPAEVRIVPRSINLANKGKWITCYIRLGENYNVADIDPNSVFLEDEIEAESFRVDEQEQVGTAKFSRLKVQEMLELGEADVAVSGELSGGTRFEGTDTIRVTDKGKTK